MIGIGIGGSFIKKYVKEVRDKIYDIDAKNSFFF